MDELRVGAVGAVPALRPAAGSAAAAPDAAGFAGALHEALQGTNRLQQAADQATQEFAVGKNRDVAGTLIAIEKANLSFQLTMQIRNRLVEAYQEVLRMSI